MTKEERHAQDGRIIADLRRHQTKWLPLRCHERTGIPIGTISSTLQRLKREGKVEFSGGWHAL